MPLMPRPGTPVIPPSWEAHHRPTANGQMTGTCVIDRPATGGIFDEAAGRTTYPDPEVLYDGPGRLQAAPMSDRAVEVGDTQETLRRYLVALPVEVTGLRINDRVRFTALSDPDADMLTRELRIVDILAGSLLWQRDLTCEEVTPTTR